MTVAENTKASELLKAYPWLTGELIRYDRSFAVLNTPVAKLFLKNATLGDVCRKAGLDSREAVELLEKLISAGDPARR